MPVSLVCSLGILHWLPPPPPSLSPSLTLAVRAFRRMESLMLRTACFALSPTLGTTRAQVRHAGWLTLAHTCCCYCCCCCCVCVRVCMCVYVCLVRACLHLLHLTQRQLHLWYSNRASPGMADVKELTPEFYMESTDFLLNLDNLDLGTTQRGERVSAVLSEGKGVWW